MEKKETKKPDLRDTLEFMRNFETEEEKGTSADRYFKEILQFCEEKRGYNVLSNSRDRILGMKFDLDWIFLDVSIHVLAERQTVVFNTTLPVVCRKKDPDEIKRYLHDISCDCPNGSGHFIYSNNRISYLCTYAYVGASDFNEKLFEHYLDDAVMMPFLKAEGILDMTAEKDEAKYDEYPDDALWRWPRDENPEDPGWM